MSIRWSELEVGDVITFDNLRSFKVLGHEPGTIDTEVIFSNEHTPRSSTYFRYSSFPTFMISGWVVDRAGGVRTKVKKQRYEEVVF